MLVNYSLAGNTTWVFWKNSKHSSGVPSPQPLEAISVPGALEPIEQLVLFIICLICSLWISQNIFRTHLAWRTLPTAQVTFSTTLLVLEFMKEAFPQSCFGHCHHSVKGGQSVGDLVACRVLKTQFHSLWCMRLHGSTVQLRRSKTVA